MKLRIRFPESHLLDATGWFRRALDSEPNFAEARIRLGRVLGLRGHHAEALGELARASQDTTDSLLRYYAELFMAAEEEALSSFSAARLHYERAAGIEPGARSPRLGLSLLARRGGDRSGAAMLLPVLRRSTPEDRVDPWRDYFLSAGRSGQERLAELRALVRSLPR